MIIGYARVSTEDQHLDAQEDALRAAGCERVFADRISGSIRSRPELDRLLDHLREGDVIVVTKYDRLARSLRDLLEIVETVKARGAGFRSLAEDIDTTTPAGRLIFHVFASIAQFERERISERTREGLEAAKRRGRVGGRPPALTDAQRREVRRMRDDEGRALADIAALFKVSTRTVRRA
ncbi:MAG: recombinase family protein [Alphaproteobacteria bacterium]|nr:recombinase family protein [Alphaproteobacteria bacterium]